jgi:adenine-specific DNA-methyltransferase
VVHHLVNGIPEQDFNVNVLDESGSPTGQVEIIGWLYQYYNTEPIACFANKVPEKVIKEIAKRQPLRVVFRDSSFESSPEKINVEEIFKLMAPNTSVKVI